MLQWKRSTDHCQGVYAQPRHFRHYDAGNERRRIVSYPEERHRDITYPHHPAHSTEYRQEYHRGILRANIANLLTNRALLRHKYTSLDLNDEKNNTDCINCSNDLDWKFIATVKKSVEDNMDNPSFNVDVLCNLLNMSRTSFYNKIKALTDQAPADYIRLIRLKHAAQLLKEQKHTITEISELTGFSDAKYFREVFKKHFNMSPSQYAKRGKEEKDDKDIK